MLNPEVPNPAVSEQLQGPQADIAGEPDAEAPRQRGSVKWFNATKGFGFITPEEGGEDLFVHQTNIKAEGFRSLREGEPVEFEVEAGPDGRFKAINISGPAGQAPQGAPPRAAAFRPGYPGIGARGMGRGGAAPPGQAMMLAGRGGHGGQGGMGPQQAFYGYPGMPPPFYVGYYFPPGADPMGGRSGRGGRGRVGPPPQQAYYPQGMQGMMPQGPPQVPTDPSGLQVVVHNLPWSCQWQQLKDTFKEWRVERADVVFDGWGRSRGFGTVRFYSRADAEAACQKLNNTQMDGRTISVRLDRFA